MSRKVNQSGLAVFSLTLLASASCSIASSRHHGTQVPKIDQVGLQDGDDEEELIKEKAPDCDLGDFVVETNTSLRPREGCESLVFSSMRLGPASKLTIEAGVKLLHVSESPAAEIRAEEGSTLIVKGEADRPVSIIKAAGSNPLAIRLGGNAKVEYLQVKNASLFAWSKYSEKYFAHMEIDNREAKEGSTGLGCLQCRIKDFRDVHVLTNAEGRPLDTTPLALLKIKAGELKITGSAPIYVSGFGALWGPSEGGSFLWPNLGYTYRVNDGLTVNGESFVLSPGVIIEFCASCSLFLNAKNLVFGSADGEAVTLKGIGSEAWAGVTSGTKVESMELNNTIVSDSPLLDPILCSSLSSGSLTCGEGI